MKFLTEYDRLPLGEQGIALEQLSLQEKPAFSEIPLDGDEGLDDRGGGKGRACEPDLLGQVDSPRQGGADGPRKQKGQHQVGGPPQAHCALEVHPVVGHGQGVGLALQALAQLEH